MLTENEYLSQNITRQYPFKDTAQFPYRWIRSFFLDIQIQLNEPVQGEIVLTTINPVTSGISLEFTIGPNSYSHLFENSEIVNSVTEEGFQTQVLPFGKLKMLFGARPQELSDNQVFNVELPINESCIIVPPQHVTSLRFQNSDDSTVEIYGETAYLGQWDQDQRKPKGTNIALTTGNYSVIMDVGASLGEGLYNPCSDLAQLPIQAINRSVPDQAGNINVSQDSCYQWEPGQYSWVGDPAYRVKDSDFGLFIDNLCTPQCPTETVNGVARYMNRLKDYMVNYTPLCTDTVTTSCREEDSYILELLETCTINLKKIYDAQQAQASAANTVKQYLSNTSSTTTIDGERATAASISITVVNPTLELIECVQTQTPIDGQVIRKVAIVPQINGSQDLFKVNCRGQTAVQYLVTNSSRSVVQGVHIVVTTGTQTLFDQVIEIVPAQGVVTVSKSETSCFPYVIELPVNLDDGYTLQVTPDEDTEFCFDIENVNEDREGEGVQTYSNIVITGVTTPINDCFDPKTSGINKGTFAFKAYGTQDTKYALLQYNLYLTLGNKPDPLVNKVCMMEGSSFTFTLRSLVENVPTTGVEDIKLQGVAGIGPYSVTGVWTSPCGGGDVSGGINMEVIPRPVSSYYTDEENRNWLFIRLGSAPYPDWNTYFEPNPVQTGVNYTFEGFPEGPSFVYTTGTVSGSCTSAGSYSLRRTRYEINNSCGFSMPTNVHGVAQQVLSNPPNIDVDGMESELGRHTFVENKLLLSNELDPELFMPARVKNYAYRLCCTGHTDPIFNPVDPGGGFITPLYMPSDSFGYKIAVPPEQGALTAGQYLTKAVQLWAGNKDLPTWGADERVSFDIVFTAPALMESDLEGFYIPAPGEDPPVVINPYWDSTETKVYFEITLTSYPLGFNISGPNWFFQEDVDFSKLNGKNQTVTFTYYVMPDILRMARGEQTIQFNITNPWGTKTYYLFWIFASQ